jgi:phosphatidate cytidylyltransferase
VDEAAGAAATPVHPKPPTPVSPEAKRAWSNLARRLLTAVIVIPPIVYLIVAGGLWTLGGVMVIILLGLREFYQLIEEKGAHPLVGYGLAAGAALPVVAYLGNEYHATVLMTAVLLAVMVAQLAKAQISEALASISGTFFGVFYVGWLLTHAVVLREFHGVVASKWGAEAAAPLHPEVGIFFVLFTVVTVVACDAGAYFAGRAYGRRKLAPRISPKKSVEGAIGGILAGTLGGALTKGVFDLLWPQFSVTFDWPSAFIFAPTLAVVAIVGDLVQSLLKRDARTKDTGRLLPGMGGVLDRIDSSLLAIPVMYYLLLAHTYLRLVQG